MLQTLKTVQLVAVIIFTFSVLSIVVKSEAQATQGRICYEYGDLGCADVEVFESRKLTALECAPLALMRHRIEAQQMADAENAQPRNEFLSRNLALIKAVEELKGCFGLNPNY